MSVEQVGQWTREEHRIRYEHVGDYRWKTPKEVDSSWTGDCKDKALWLYAKLKEAGVRDLRLVIGRKDRGSRQFHAWLYLTLDGLAYLLDPTRSGDVWKQTEFGDDEYIPAYSFDGESAYSHGIDLRFFPIAVSPAE